MARPDDGSVSVARTMEADASWGEYEGLDTTLTGM